ncbi:probable mitochondrial glutathione transporter SLC25A40 [Episyrphus balteatus]|uniref:probable mitochondrial glutathione transporter SLC25A40 n=1 Tax=Episyrphus balteatus TaxID=286459 RepID=UPI002485B0CC|nr:probable mitochondrial glutathione transporter SLC25A40 [Episyrphus balteatus]
MTPITKMTEQIGRRKIDIDDPRFRIKPHQQIASACTGGIITSLIMTPLDVVKTRIQTQQKLLLSNKCFLYCNGLMDHLCPCGPNSAPMKNHVHLNGTIDAVLKISRSEGIKSLWSGLGPTLVSALPSTVIYFVSYEQIRNHTKDWHNKYIGTSGMPVYVPLFSGVLSRIFAVTLVSPLELIRTKMQSQKMTYKEMTTAVRSMINAEGALVLWKGLPPTIYRDVPFSGIYWSCYEALKWYYQVTEPTFGFSFTAGALSGSIAATITTPFDLIKTYQQIEFGEQVIYTDKPRQNIPIKTTTQRLKEVYRAHGVRGLFVGLGPRLAKVAPACAVMISSFEYGKSFFYNLNVHRYDEKLLIMQNVNNHAK